MSTRCGLRAAGVCWVVISNFLAVSVAEADDAVATATRKWLEQNESQVLAEYIDLLRIPNVSRDRADIRRNAEHLITMMKRRGLAPRLLEIPDAAPLVYGERRVAGATSTYVFYAHYDGQPVVPAEWTTPPFDPVLRSTRLDEGGVVIPDQGRGRRLEPQWRIYARSASDDKAQIMAMLAALDALAAAGIEPRANLKFVFEGEEELGSPNLGKLLRANRELLRGDLWIICDGPEFSDGQRTVVFGARGIQTLEITVYGPNRALHSGHYGNWAPNPAMMLAQLLASMMDHDGRVLIEHFYDGVVPLTDLERKALSDIPDDDPETLRSLGLARSDGGGKERVEMITFPALNIDGLSSGQTGAEAANAIPVAATASIDVRLVKGMTTQQTVDRIIDHIRKQGYFVTAGEPDTASRLKHARIARVVVDPAGYNAARTPMDNAYAQRVVAALRSEGSPLVLLPTSGGSVPLAIIEEAVGAPTISVPIVNRDNNQHAKDENLRLQNLWTGIDAHAALLTMQ